jgi:protein-S-isoprenylcysteine O-methyltransferase Ste14
MTVNSFAFNAAATVYLVLGSAHEELRLRAAYGTKYEDYRQSQVPFYVPGLAQLLTLSVSLKYALAHDTGR